MSMTFSSTSSRLRPLLALCPLAALMTLGIGLATWPVGAATSTTGLDLPNDPLITESQVPPNILFVLDDSGSMAFTYMPDDVPSTSTVDVSDQAYTRNTIYYNPATTYQPWLQADGTRMTGGTSYGAVYADFNRIANSTINLASTSSCGTYNYNNSSDDSAKGKQVCGGVQTFYVPKDTTSTDSTYLGNGSNYYRYQILTNGSIYRSEYLSYSASDTGGASGTLTTSASASGKSFSSAYTLQMPANVSSVSFTASGANSSSYTLYVKNGSAVTSTNNSGAACSSSNGSTKTCSVSSPTSGATYYVNIYATGNNSISGVTLSYTLTYDNGCATSTSGNGWRNCTEVTPTGRSEADEMTNYATWYSYYRTRMKVAKAGAGEAFGQLGKDVRVGFRTIWGRNGSTTSGNIPSQDTPIPVNYDNGLFEDTTYNNRSQWYSRLFNTIAYNGTPLHSALDLAGRYYSSSDATGPYGPETSTSQYACRQNFTILTTDGYWNSLYYYKNGALTSVSGVGYSVSVGNQDNEAGSSIASPTGTTYQYAAASPYKDNYSNTLADVAMKYWKADLRTDLNNVVPTNSSDPAFWQHMVTFGISIGQQGTLDPTKDPSTVTWPNPNDSEDNERIDDLWHAAVNGHGEFVAASDPDEFANGLTSALAAITERIGSFSNATATSSSASTSTQLFSAYYISGVWSGQLLACSATVSTCTAANATWKATDSIPAADARNIFTMRQNGNGAKFPVAYQTNALGDAATDYIRGVQTNELQNGGTLRNRTTVLGDITDSSPTYVSTTNTVYVGANDGMLHAFNASTGAEVFAYVPKGLSLTDLATLPSADYGHRYFVDGPIVVSTTSQTPSQNLLVGALGRGGKGLYALDVSNPSGFANANVLWEANETTGNNMGKILGKPFIAKLNNGVTALVTGNGINSTTGHAVLLVYNLATGDLIREIDTGSGGATTATTNGLFAPTGWDNDSSGTIDYVYAGDLQGHVWKFNLSSTDPASWGVANSGSALFSATNDSGTAQPITSGILLVKNPTTLDTWVFFGTGRYLLTTDITDKSVQTMYGVIDGGATVARSALTKRTILVSTTSDGYSVRGFQANASLPTSSKGWYINLLTDASNPEGERVVSTPQIQGSTLIFSSIIPTSDGCQSDGTGWVNALDAFTGTSSATSYFDLDGSGSTSDDTVTSNNTTVAVGSVSLGVGMVSSAVLYNGQFTASGSNGTTATVKTSKLSSARTSWREVLLED